MSEHNRVPNSPDEADSVEAAEVDTSEVTDEKDEGPVRRPLIRATLKHPEGTPPPPRQAPVFTMHQQERAGASAGRGQNRNGRFVRDSGHPNKKKGSRDRQGQGAQDASSKGNSSGGKHRSRPDRQQRAASGNRAPSSRRDRGRSR